MFTPEEIELLHNLLEKAFEEARYCDREKKPYWYDTAESLNDRFRKLHEFNRKIDDIDYRTMGIGDQE